MSKNGSVAVAILLLAIIFVALPSRLLLAANVCPIGPANTWRVVYFWSSACPCVRACESYSLIPLAKKYKGKISFEAIATNGYDLALPRAELKVDIAEHHLPYPVILDTNHALAKYFDAKITPATFVIDPGERPIYPRMGPPSFRVGKTRRL